MGGEGTSNWHPKFSSPTRCLPPLSRSSKTAASRSTPAQPRQGQGQLAEIIGNYDGLRHPLGDQGDREDLEKATKLKVIGRAGIGVDNVEIPAATARASSS